ncbi:hypothetical protein ACB092_04G003100 [Castanea dentata]
MKENQFPRFSQPPNRASEPTHTIEISKLLKQFERIKHKHNVSSTPEPKPQEIPSHHHHHQRSINITRQRTTLDLSGFGKFLGFGLLDTMGVGFCSSKNNSKIFNLGY